VNVPAKVPVIVPAKLISRKVLPSAVRLLIDTGVIVPLPPDAAGGPPAQAGVASTKLSPTAATAAYGHFMAAIVDPRCRIVNQTEPLKPSSITQRIRLVNDQLNLGIGSSDTKGNGTRRATKGHDDAIGAKHRAPHRGSAFRHGLAGT